MKQNRWTVFEFLKARTLATGQVPARQELDSEFSSLDREEIEGGIQEFTKRLGKWATEETSYA
ncbi:hypothetical protein ACK8P5_00655 [Paenibacillus sp. EC2-1]|uniref:hypothetical protein n=1 Tax=Paenibacillus sp. EC2-1 TaxID=3388665 RepID=UPI003BEECD6B